jgi:alkylation response protein AidB-like acyl-CoA dehydrogenase
VTIDLALDERQEQLQRAAHELFEERCPTRVVREIEDGELGYQPDLWEDMAARGWLGLTLPSTYGGSDGRFVDLYALYEEMGRFLVPSPHLDTVAIGADLIASAGSETQKRGVLPAIADGHCLISVATLESSGEFSASGIDTTATRQGDGFSISGQKLLVAWAPAADHFLCTARTGGADRAEGVTVFLVDAKTSGISWIPLANISGAALFEVDFDQVTAPADAVVGEVDRGWTAFSRSATKAAVLQTASIVGAARAVLDMTSRYAQDREQFGHPIGSYQAVQYMVSDILIDLHSVDMLAKQAAYRIGSGRPFDREAAMAIAFGKRAAAHLHRQAHEVLAGIGFMVEHDLQLFSRRSKFWENNLGDARYHEERLAAALDL